MGSPLGVVENFAIPNSSEPVWAREGDTPCWDQGVHPATRLKPAIGSLFSKKATPPPEGMRTMETEERKLLQEISRTRPRVRYISPNLPPGGYSRDFEQPSFPRRYSMPRGGGASTFQTAPRRYGTKRGS